MTINPQIIIPVVTALTALILLMAGGRLLKPAIGLAGGLFGAGCGLLLAPSLGIDVSPFIIALITGIIASVIAVGIAKFAILLTLAIGLAIATPVVTWYSVGLGDGKEVISDVIEAASTEAPQENTSEIQPDESSENPTENPTENPIADLSTTNAMGLAFGMLTEHATVAMRSGIKRANAAWDVIPAGPRLMLVGAAIAGLLLGLLIATFMPHFAASIVTSSFGSVLLIEALRNGATIIWSQQDFAAISPNFLLILYCGLALAGLGLQLTLFRRPPQEKAKA
ncbi:MAG: hypothetical protein H8E91_01810 [Planctomycetes bacterium]|nr:hypothetical protein [Planctomycetota bacterium]